MKFFDSQTISSGAHALTLLRKQGIFSPEQSVDPTRDPDIFGAFTFRHGVEDYTYWMDPKGQVYSTSNQDDITKGVNVEYEAARHAYTGAIEATRLTYHVPVPQKLYVGMDPEFPNCFLVFDDNPAKQTVRFVIPSADAPGEYTVMDGYTETPDGTITWDKDTLAQRSTMARERKAEINGAEVPYDGAHVPLPTVDEPSTKLEAPSKSTGNDFGSSL